MTCVAIHGRLFLGKLRNSMQIANCFKHYGIFKNVRYLQPSNRCFKTNIIQLHKVSETVELTAEKYPTNLGQEEGMVTPPLEKQMLTELSKYPTLNQVSTVRLKSFLCHLGELGFSVATAVEMVDKCLDIIGRSDSQLLQTIMCFKQCKFSDEEVIAILYSSPEYFLVDPNVIVSRYKSLRKQFSHKLLKHIFSNSPGIMLIKWKALQDKMEYLNNVMRVRNHEIALSKVLTCPLDEIKARHLFLERAGLYKTPDPKLGIPSANPRFSQIVDTEGDWFAVNIAGLTAEEYFVLKEMVALEDEETSISDYDDDENIE